MVAARTQCIACASVIRFRSFDVIPFITEKADAHLYVLPNMDNTQFATLLMTDCAGKETFKYTSLCITSS